VEAGEVLILEEQGLSVDPGVYLLLALAETGAVLCRVGEDEAGEADPLGPGRPAGSVLCGGGLLPPGWHQAPTGEEGLVALPARYAQIVSQRRNNLSLPMMTELPGSAF